jgi:hypothetical protein
VPGSRHLVGIEQVHKCITIEQGKVHSWPGCTVHPSSTFGVGVSGGRCVESWRRGGGRRVESDT